MSTILTSVPAERDRRFRGRAAGILTLVLMMAAASVLGGARVLDLSAGDDQLSVSLSVDEAQARGLLLGDRVELSREGTQTPFGTGSVTDVRHSGTADASPESQVRIAIDNRARRVRAGQAVSARIFASHAGRALLVPNRALAWISGQPAVFVAASPQTASVELVTLGGCDGEQTEVRGGLTPGQRVVSEGVRTLREASFL